MSEKQENEAVKTLEKTAEDEMNFDDFDEQNSSELEEDAMEEEIDEEMENKIDHEALPLALDTIPTVKNDEGPSSGRLEGSDQFTMSEEELYMQQLERGELDENFGAGLTEEELALLASSPEGVEMLLAQHELDYDESIKEIESKNPFFI